MRWSWLTGHRENPPLTSVQRTSTGRWRLISHIPLRCGVNRLSGELNHRRGPRPGEMYEGLATLRHGWGTSASWRTQQTSRPWEDMWSSREEPIQRKPVVPSGTISGAQSPRYTLPSPT